MTGDASEPQVMTVDEAAQLLRIGRSAAYALCRQWIASGGREGLPVLVLGRSFRVPVAALRQMLDHPRPPRAGEDLPEAS